MKQKATGDAKKLPNVLREKKQQDLKAGVSQHLLKKKKKGRVGRRRKIRATLISGYEVGMRALKKRWPRVTYNSKKRQK